MFLLLQKEDRCLNLIMHKKCRHLIEIIKNQRDGLDFIEKNAIKLIFLERVKGVGSFYELKGEAHGRVA